MTDRPTEEKPLKVASGHLTMEEIRALLSCLPPVPPPDEPPARRRAFMSVEKKLRCELSRRERVRPTEGETR